jgi:protein TonB
VNDPPTVVVASAADNESLTSIASAPSTEPALEVQISQGVTEANLIHKVEPVYPAKAQSMRLEGPVTLLASIAEDGSVRHIKVVSGPEMLATAAIEAVRQWRYTPLLLDGKPTAVEREITVVFKLN